MAISALSGFSPAISLIDSLSPISQISQLQPTSSLFSLSALSSTQESISSIGRLLNQIENLQTAATALATPGAFVARTADSSDLDVATAVASPATPTGSFSVQVDQLAQGQTLTTAAQASSLSPIGGGSPTTLSFAFAGGGSRSVTLGVGDNTLAGIADAINSADIGVDARLLTSTGGVRLELTGPSGAGNAFTIDVSGDAAVAGLLAFTGGSGGPTLTAAARDAQGQVNGIAFSGSTNTVNTSIAGLTLNLADIGTTTLTVTAGGDATAAVRRFVDAFNEVQTGFAGLAASTPIFGLTASVLGAQLTGTLNAAGGGGNPFTALAEIGISRRLDGTLGFNEATFQQALAENPTGVAAIFSNGGTGIAEQVAAQTVGPLSPEQLLPVLTPALTFQGTLSASSDNTLLLSLFGQNSLLGSSNSSALSNELLFAQLIGASQLVSEQNGTPLLELLIGQTLLPS